MPSTHEERATLVDENSKQCRICLDTDNQSDIISPCLCSGGSAFIHRKCLNHWRSRNARGIGFEYCDICHFKYVIETVLDDPRDERKRYLKYYCFIIRDTMGAMIVLQLVIVLLAWLLKSIDKNGDNITPYFPTTMHVFAVYYWSALILFMATLGLVALILYLCSNISGGTSLRSSDGSSSRGSSSRSSGSSSTNSSSGACVGVAIVILIIFAAIGVFVGIFLSVVYVRKIMKHHAGKLWLRQEAEKYEVKDFQGRRFELQINPRTPSAPSETWLSVHVEVASEWEWMFLNSVSFFLNKCSMIGSYWS